ncbi:hypothetical protein [Cellulosilyticum sp. I15G10I2]|uniref:hypothetical protein n=1 Tax=Cellulosilyticum sp. I15G10I2 TaxID=1892843 RepID=UPI00085CDEEF|nr:hypothetical protein [Cellulosilyticum sp. I15G10I2]
MKYCVLKNTTTVIDGSQNPDEILIQNAINSGFLESEIEILTQEEYLTRKEIEIEEPQPSKIDILNAKIATIDSYKHEIGRNFPYGNCGGVQRFNTDDVALINLTIEAFEDGDIDSIEWKYSNGLYDTVTDVTYFINMKRVGKMYIAKAFAIEKIVVEELKAIYENGTIEDLEEYNEKVRFDELFI